MKTKFILLAILPFIATLLLAATSAYHKVQIVDGTGNSTAYEKVQIVDEEGQNVQIVDASINYLNVRDYGAKGDGINDDTEEIQACVDEANLTGKGVYVPVGIYVISSALNLARVGAILQGENAYLSQIKQITNGQNAINILTSNPADTIQGPGAHQITIRNLRIIGNGIGTSTGDGVNASGFDTSYNGDWLQIQNCYIRGFERGVYTRGFGQCNFSNTLLTYNNYNLVVDPGSANSFNFIGVASGRSGAVGILLNNGVGGTLVLNDQGNQPVAIRANSGVKVNIIGGNFESHSTRAIEVKTGADVTIIGSRFLKGTGAEASSMDVENGSSLVPVNCKTSGFLTTTPMISQGATARVQPLGNGASASDFGATAPQDLQSTISGEVFRPTPFQQRLDNSVPAGAAALRGGIIQIVGRTGVADDGIGMYITNSAGSHSLDLWGNSQVPKTAWTWTVDQTLGQNTDFILNSTNGTKIGTATTQKLGFFNATPIVQPSGVTPAQALVNIGLLANPAGTMITGTGVIDFDDTAAQNSDDATITVTGAAAGDAVHIGVPTAAVNADTSYSAWVSAADTVTVRFNNYSSGSVDPTSGTFRAVVYKP